MIQISEYLQLQQITINHEKELFKLMSEVYPAAYKHFWKDEGQWYLRAQYSKTNIEKELAQEQADYYFIVWKGEKVGNFRILWDTELEGFSGCKQVKLHRIYLHSKTQGKGIGKQLLTWLENEAIKKQYELIWLDAMDEQPQAFTFYKKMGYQYHSHCFLDFELLHTKVRKMSQVYKKLV
ncbi:GNAT family N-acetyltransferase [Tenacibaculum sp. TC6]|uniref:GNAT family N-acetyltransferase n=1 Tax=Tenacibaculum sp. TC6 TaxID=3423223 RepID=UPI003D36C4AB